MAVWYKGGIVDGHLWLETGTSAPAGGKLFGKKRKEFKKTRKI
jgi:hypothetical protein